MKNVTEMPFQDGPNGPLSAHALGRLKALKDQTGLSYAALGQKVGLSGTFVYNLMNKGMNVSTIHIKRMEEAVARMEAGEDLAPQSAASVGGDTLPHSYHLRPDFKVTISLPIDLTQKEAERLSLFIQSLPCA